MPYLTDHLALTSKFCPDCGWRQITPREPGEVKAMKERAMDAIAASPGGHGALALALMLAVGLTLIWVEGAMTDDQFLRALTLPTVPAPRP